MKFNRRARGQSGAASGHELEPVVVRAFSFRLQPEGTTFRVTGSLSLRP